MFKKFLEGSVPFGKMDQIIKNLGSKYQPSTFGIEIEFKPAKTGVIDEKEAKEAFERDVDLPEKPEEWVEENPPPEKPKKEKYTFDKNDTFKNYYNLDLNMTAMPDKLPEEYSKLIVKLRDISGDKNLKQLDTFGIIFEYFRRLYIGNKPDIGKLALGLYNVNDFMKDDETFEIWKTQFKSVINRNNSTEIQNYIRRNGGYIKHAELTSEQMDIIDKLASIAWKCFNDYIKFHEKRAEGLNEKIFRQLAVEKYREDISEWKEKFNDWKEEEESIINLYKKFNYDYAYDRWLEKNEEHFIRTKSIKEEVEETIEWLESKGQVARKNKTNDPSIVRSKWNVFEDEEGIVEIASPVLQKDDFEFLKVLFDYLSDKEFDTDTGCHIHVGMPPLADAFDLLSIIYLTDEKVIIDLAKRTESAIEEYANRKDLFFWKLIGILENKVYTSPELLTEIKDNMTRYFGVNLMAYFKYGTVEFRYLSSQVIHSENIFKLINYFMLLPNLARSRNQIRYDANKGSIVFTRRPGGKIEVASFAFKDSKNPKQETLPVDQLRFDPKQKQQTTLKNQLVQKYGPIRKECPFCGGKNVVNHICEDCGRNS